MATSPFQSNPLRGQGEEQQLNIEEIVMTSRPVGQEGHLIIKCVAHGGTEIPTWNKNWLFKLS